MSHDAQEVSMKRKGTQSISIARFCFVLFMSFFCAVASAQKTKETVSNLDQRVYANPSLRVVETPVEASIVRSELLNYQAIESFQATHGKAWSVIVDRRRGVVGLLDGGAIPFIPGSANSLQWDSISPECSSAVCVPKEKLEQLARKFLAENAKVFGINPDQFALIPEGTGPVDHMVYINFRQVVSGIPVADSAVWFRINNGNLIQVATENVAPVSVNLVPTVTRETAWIAMLNFLGKDAPLKKSDADILDGGSLILLPRTPQNIDPNAFHGVMGSGFDHFLAYRFLFRKPGVTGTWETFVDAHTGEVLAFRDANRYGSIRGGVYKTDKNPTQTEVNVPFPYADYGVASFSDAAGNFPGTSGTSTMTGRTGSAGNVGGVDMVDTCGAISLSADPSGVIDFGGSGGADCTTPGVGGPGNTHAARTQYWNVSQIKTKGYTYLPGNTWLQGLLTDNVNLNNTCNAYWDGTSVNFFLSGGGCGNTGELPGVSLHEWGHGMDDNDGSGGNSPPVETRADWTAILQTHEACAGGGFFVTLDSGCGAVPVPGIGLNCGGYGDCCLNCSGIRDADWANHADPTPWTPANNGQASPGFSCSPGSYNGPCGWEDHCESGIATQALWDFVNRDVVGPPSNLDVVTAWQLEDRLFYSSMPTLGNMYACTPPNSNGCGGGSLYATMRAIDDDGDGTANGTPHAAAIFAALNRHKIACGLVGDVTNQNQTSCPALTTPTVSGVAGSNQVTVNWTSGGANATRYFVYRNETSCTAGFTKIATVTAPTLTYADTNCVNGITYYYRVQAATANDSCVSPMSNCATVIPQPCAGAITLDRAVYNCADTVNITVLDSTVNLPVQVKVWSTTDGTQKTITLANNPPGSATYTGSFTTTTSASPGPTEVRVADGATITVRYTDPDYCGTLNQDVDNTVPVDCVGPVISNVQAINVTGNSADTTWSTNESANSYTVYDTVTPPAANNANDATMTLSHSVSLTGLNECTDYYYYVRSTDPAGNQATDNNGGAYYTFTTGKNVNPTYTKTEAPPVPIPDNDPAGASSVLNVTDNKTIMDVNVRVNISHTYDSDLTLYLIGPDSTQVTLSALRGGGGDNFTDTVFDDEASTPIGSGAPPFTGSFIPDQPLSAFDGKNALGNWTLKVVDSAGIDVGAINNWSITFQYPAQSCGPHAKYSSHALVSDTCASGGPGNNNTYWDAGEDIQFSLTLNNDGSVPLTGVSATVVPLTPGVIMIDDTATYPNIAIDANAISNAPHFTVHLPSSLNCGDIVNFRVDVTTAQGNWSSNFSQTLGNVVPGITTPINETFTVGDPPAGWTLIDGGTGTERWTTTNPGGRAIPAGMTAPIEAIDSDFDGFGVTQDDSLISPAFDCTGATNVTLNFATYYNDFDANDFAFVDVSTNGGSTWTNHTTWTADVGSPATAANQALDITALAGNSANVKVRFHYVGAFDWYWLVDNVSVVVTRPGTCIMPVCGPSVKFDTSFNPNSTLLQICGDGDGVVEPGEKWQVTVRLKNNGSVAATSTIADLAVNGSSVINATILGNPGSYGVIPPGGTSTATYQFLPDAAATCGNLITFDINNIQSAEGSYVANTSAFSTPVGVVSPGGNETRTQQTTPLNATSNVVNSNLGPAAFTLATASSGTLSYSENYTQKPAGSVKLFGPDDFVDASNWTSSGGSLQSEAKCATSTPVPSNQYYRIDQNQNLTLTNAVSTVGYTNIRVLFHGAVQSAGGTLFLDWSPDGTTWNLGVFSTGSTTWQCDQTVALPAGAAGKAGFKIRFRDTGSSSTKRGKVDYVQIQGDAPASGSWTTNARVSLIDPSSTVTVLKAYGVADASPYNVQPFYTGPGTYQVRLEENNGGTATVTAGSMNVVMNPVNNCNVASCGGPPPVNSTGANAVKVTKNPDGNTLLVTYDNGTCAAQKAILVYGNIGNYGGYAGCADGDMGNGGSDGAVDASGLNNVWFNVVWTNATTAGHPGYNSAGERSWNVGAFCGMTADDHTHNTCP